MSTEAHADIFLYPHSPQVCEDKGDYKFTNNGDYNEVESCVCVWITSPDCANWIRGNNKIVREIGLTEMFPVKLFEGKKEGDVVVHKFDNVTLFLTLNQKGSRYGNCGNFEDLLFGLTSDANGGIVSQGYFTPNISQERQHEIMKDTHTRYAVSIGRESIFGPVKSTLQELKDAVSNYNVDAVRIIIANNPDINVNDGTPSPLAMSCDKPEIFTILMANGGNMYGDYEGTRSILRHVNKTGNVSMRLAMLNTFSNRRNWNNPNNPSTDKHSKTFLKILGSLVMRHDE